MTDHLATIGKIYQAFGQGDIPTILAHMADGLRDGSNLAL